ncbi:alpha/beta hydrolase [Streptomyces sp. SM12]|uniref:alpha/beta hydrolase n=1 Tax=Streptomyces sp. SM12 TaxID=1071602 RepID=UPI000CD4F4CF|nr:alpha/beta hydrolase [Streptomyces sp. SM12]
MSLIRESEIPSFSGNLGQLESAVRSLDRDGEAVFDGANTLHSTFQGLAGGYEAPETSDLLVTTLPVRSGGEQLRDAVSAVSRALGDYAADARHIDSRLDSLRARARAVPDVSSDDPDYGRHVEESESIRVEAALLVASFERMEAETVRAVESALPLGTHHFPVFGPYLPGQGPWMPLAVVPTFSTPAEAAAWWRGLSESERAELIELSPAEIGATDGLPVAVRDRANRVVFERMWRQDRPDLAYERHLDAEPERYVTVRRRHYYGFTSTEVETEEWKEWNERKKEISALLTVNDRLNGEGDYSDPTLPRAYLLVFDQENRGKVAIANGNPDTADHTAVLVPGTGSELKGVRGDLNRTVDVWQTSSELARPGETVSTVTWIGYDSPEKIFPDATRRVYAEEGAPVLNGFLDGLEASRGGPGQGNTTVIAHSYGSTLVGAATQEAGRSRPIAADSIIAVGSPGMTVGHADQLGVGAENVWSMQAPFSKDQVAEGGRLFHGETDSRWRRGLFGVPYHDTDHWPNVPADEDFGAGRMRNDAQDHSDYWSSELNLRNQAHVVVGRLSGVIRE